MAKESFVNKKYCRISIRSAFFQQYLIEILFKLILASGVPEKNRCTFSEHRV